MRALRVQRAGHPLEVLELVELPEPEPGPGEALIEVLAAPIGPMDRLMIRGHYPLPPPGGFPGAQGIGRVLVDPREGESALAPGTAVLLPIRCGTWRERVCVPASTLVPLPPRPDLAALCTLRVEGLSAAVLLDALRPGDWFVHSPGGGSVGRYLTALAQARGLHSVALVGSREPIADLWGLGADHVLVREPGLGRRLIELGLPAPSVAFDGSGGATTELLASCLDAGGELVVYGGASRAPAQMSIGQLVFRQLHLRGFWLHQWSREVGEARAQARLTELVAAAVDLGLRERVVERFDLEAWADAIRLAERPNASGRVVLTIAS
ncbi:zinc-binding dehydrogenase [Pseudenhygromyxa sp. WMMC2535]|uniref:MDR family NADPH-dependent oxidoreductase n=1 Tax=Pseudenhygromyxa sp. WMMC2535 TaxID=2712867 RepID=UPI001557BF99|nr:2-enoyl thioester reductase domain-containing protein [Pseudenhygromyxa sp. WMMC2535]NVB38004.1 zinc-binding dehydrogenase [Pseudenhygromyxa sp. WMMC2535]